MVHNLWIYKCFGIRNKPKSSIRVRHNTMSNYIVLHAGRVSGFKVNDVELSFYDVEQNDWIYYDNAWEHYLG